MSALMSSFDLKSTHRDLFDIIASIFHQARCLHFMDLEWPGMNKAEGLD